MRGNGPRRASDRRRSSAPEAGLGNLTAARSRSDGAHRGEGQQLLLGEARGVAFIDHQPLTDRRGVFRESRHDEPTRGMPISGHDWDFAADNPSAATVRPNRAVRSRPAEAPMLLTVIQVEAALQLGRTRTYELLRSGEIPVRRVGRLIRVSRLALEEWVAQGEQSSGQH